MRFVYLVKANNKYKIGVAKNLQKRISSIQTGNGTRIKLVCARRTIRAFNLEKSLHNQIKKFTSEGGREWFTLSPTQAIQVAIMLNKNPEVETADLIIENIKIDFEKISETYWNKLDKLLDKKPTQKVIEHVVKVKEPLHTEEELYSDALKLITEMGKASTSLLQRRLRIGYGKAARILERLEEEGRVSAADGSRPRYLLINE